MLLPTYFQKTWGQECRSVYRRDKANVAKCLQMANTLQLYLLFFNFFMGFKFFKIICKREEGGNVAVPDIFSYTVEQKKERKKERDGFFFKG